MTPTIVTYQYAYLRGTVDLCPRHAETPPASLPVLGPVSHGARRGTCDACRAEAFAAQGLDADGEVQS